MTYAAILARPYNERIRVGTQGILQGTYETFAAAAVKHFNGSLKGTPGDRKSEEYPYGEFSV